MDISSINSQNLSDAKGSSKVGSKKGDSKNISGGSKTRSSGDTLSISSEAKHLSHILAKISSGQYNTPEVLRETAMRIDNELRAGNE